MKPRPCIVSGLTGALKDNSEQPQLNLCEDACVQCGLCRATCLENVITLAPQLNFTEETRNHRMIKEEEPFNCIRCGKAFETKSSIERMMEKLEGHAMFDGDKIDLIKMCATAASSTRWNRRTYPWRVPRGR